MRRPFLSAFLFSLLCLPLTACGGSAATSQTPVAATTDGRPAPREVWHHGMSKDQQMAFMKRQVVPPMKQTFQAYNADRFANFGCQTCHGPAFKDPNDYLPKLTEVNGQLTAFQEHPAIAKFMAERVVPTMADAMGLKPYDPQTHEGFGCRGCHAVVKK